MRIFLFMFVFLLLASPLLAADPQIHRDLAYAEPKNEQQTLDVYVPAEGKDHPIVFWIHGGWTNCDKTDVLTNPQTFADKGFILVAPSYRVIPDVTMKEVTSDIAKAIRWTHDHATEYRGNPNSIVVMGDHQAGHLASLVCTDDRFLKAEGMSLSIIKGCVSVDTADYDIEKLIRNSKYPKIAAYYKQVFGDEEGQKDLSPIFHIEKGKSIPPFLILHAELPPDARSQSKSFAVALGNAGVSAKVYDAVGRKYIGPHLVVRFDDKPTQVLWEFLTGAVKK